MTIGQLTIGSTYTPSPWKRPPAAASLPPQRTYRAVCLEDGTDEVLECIMCATYRKAHLCALEWDDLYDYPQQHYFVERSLDGGQTWEIYMADEFIGGRPAWTHDNL